MIFEESIHARFDDKNFDHKKLKLNEDFANLLIIDKPEETTKLLSKELEDVLHNTRKSNDEPSTSQSHQETKHRWKYKSSHRDY